MTILALTLSTGYFPRAATWLRDLFLIVTGSMFTAVLARIEIPLPFTPVPITGQTFGVLLIGAVLGSKRGAASLALYLLEGALGLPFFAGGAHGIGIIFGASGGYLIGFLAAAYVVGLLAERGLEQSVRTSFITFLIGTVIIYTFGVARLSVLLGSISQAVAFGLAPFLIGDAIKLCAAALALPSVWKLIQ